jgi:hypothetical protein
MDGASAVIWAVNRQTSAGRNGSSGWCETVTEAAECIGRELAKSKPGETLNFSIDHDDYSVVGDVDLRPRQERIRAMLAAEERL